MIFNLLYHIAVFFCVVFSIIVTLEWIFTKKVDFLKHRFVLCTVIALIFIQMINLIYKSPQLVDLAALASLFIIHLAVLYHRTTNKSVSQDMYDFMTLHDHLTQLPNRQYLNQYLNQQHNTKSIAFFHINLDRFKLINHVFGHQQADILLSLIAQRLNHLMQDKTLLFRISGDELLFVIEDHHAQHIEQWANKIIDTLNKPFKIESKDIYITSSIGIAISPQHGQTLPELLIHADTAMIQAKKQGRNNYHIYDPNLVYHFEHFNPKILNDLYTAHQNQQLVLHYQPKFNTQNLQICGVEALLRWQHPQYGLLYPKDFITVAEKAGIIIPMTYWTLEESCRQAQLWRKQGLIQFLPIAINIPSLVFEQEKLLHYAQLFIERYQIQANDLAFEITESTAMQNIENSQLICDKIQQLSIQILIDDFGVGYSNFMYLKDLSIDELKIDRSFLQNVEYSDKTRTILQYIIELAQQLNLSVIVEGIENEAQLNILKTLKCNKVQGFYLAKPSLAEDLTVNYEKISKHTS